MDIINKATNQMVGDICIVGEPNLAGEIEIGYGTYAEFQRQGFMTEGLAGLILWAKNSQSCDQPLPLLIKKI